MTRKKIVVVGSYVTDLTSYSKRLPNQGETLKGEFFKTGPGGKGSNQAVAAHRAGADVTMVTRIGDDAFGKLALDFYESENMITDSVFLDKEHPTGAALIMVGEEDAQNIIVVILGACDHFSKEDLDTTKSFIDGADIVLAQLEINYEATAQVLRYAKTRNCVTVLNPAPAQTLGKDILSYVDIITPNESEASLLSGITVDGTPDSSREGAQKLLEQGIRKVIITLGENGAYGTDGDEELFIPSNAPFQVVDTTGAGDAFNGGFVAGLSYGYEFFEAIRFGNAVSGLSVTRFGTAPAMPYEDEILAHYQNPESAGR